MNSFRSIAGLVMVMVLAGCATMQERRDPAQALWDRLSPESSGGPVPEVEARLPELYRYGPDPERCARHRAGLEQQLERIPVSLSVLSIAEQCAALLDDAEWQARLRSRIDLLVDHAWRDNRGSSRLKPVTILATEDIEVLARERGLKIKWARHLPMQSWRFSLVEASLVDRDGMQRRCFFDLLDALLRINDPELRRFPLSRAQLAWAAMEADALAGDLLALTGHLYMDATTGEASTTSMQRALLEAWEGGVPGAAVAMLELCVVVDTDCDDEILQAMIDDLRSQEIAEAWALEAALALRSEPGALNDATIGQALERAGVRTPPGSMAFYVANLLREQAGDAESAAAATELLRRAMDQGLAAAHATAALDLLRDGRPLDDTEVLSHTDAAADAGDPQGLYLRGIRLGPKTRSGFAALLDSMKAGHDGAAFMVAMVLDDAKVGIPLIARAAYGGHPPALITMAQLELARKEPDPEAALQWLYAGSMRNDPESTARMAALLWRYPALAAVPERSAIELVLQLHEQAGIEAALRVPRLLFETPGYKDPQQGIALLEALYREGLVEAAVELGRRYLEGAEVDPDPAQAMGWFERALTAGRTDVTHDLARAACGAGGSTESHPAVHAPDPLRGQALVEELLARDPGAEHLATLAACQAALGDTAGAVQSLQQAIEQAAEDPVLRERLQTELDRLRPTIADSARAADSSH